MGAICDVYDAVTSDRPYRRGWNPAMALAEMNAWGNHIDKELFSLFVSTVGIYPVGSLVRLNSERLAVVVAQHASNWLTPVVRVFFSVRSNLHIDPITLDLSVKACRDKITGCESPTRWQLMNCDRFWQDLH